MRIGPWLGGLALALVVLGPALGPGALFNLDLVLPPDVPVPRGVWGLGPELPRRVPLWLPVAWLSPLIGGDVAGKALMVAAITVAFVGAYRLAGTRSVVTSTAAGLLYALSPFLLTRLAVGHLMVVVPMAVLPWVLRSLLDPAVDLRRTFLGAFALGFAGHYGGAIALIIVSVGLVATRGRNLGRVLGLTLLAQLPWIVPGIVVYAEGARIVDAAPFATYAEGVGGFARLLAGHGFWNPTFQVGWPGGPLVALAGVSLVGFAWYGRRELPGPTAGRQAALAAIGLAITVASALPGVRDVYVWLSQNPIGSVLREGQRAFPLFLVWLAPASALGARRAGRALADRASALRSGVGGVVEILPLAFAVFLAGPGLWGIGGQLHPVAIPDEWAQARALIQAEPGTVLALPWNQYFDLQIDGTSRRTLNPMPLYLGGDVIASSDPQLAEDDRRERVDPREPTVEAIVDDVVAQRVDAVPDPQIARRLADSGVRWVILLHQVDWTSYNALNRDPGIESVLRGPSLELYRVRAWPGLVDADGVAVTSDPVVEPWMRVAPSAAAVVNRPAASGWLRGTEPASATAVGTLAVPAGDGPVWFWPSIFVILADLLTLAAVLVAVRSLWRERLERRRFSAREAGDGMVLSGGDDSCEDEVLARNRQ